MSEENVNPEAEVSTEATPVQEPQPVVSEDWKSSLSEDLKSDSSLADINDIESLAKSYIHGQKELGGRIRIPGEDASAEAKDAFYTELEKIPGVVRINEEDKSGLYAKLGRPETSADYKVTAPEGIDIDSDRLAKYAEIAHKQGLNNDQFNALVQVQLSEAQTEVEAFEQSRQSGEEALKELWGQEYNNRLAGAQAAAKAYSEKYPEAMAELLNSPAGNNPAVLDMFAEIYKQGRETGAIAPATSSSSFGVTPNEAREQIAEIRGNSAHPYNNPKDPEHQEALAKVNRLYKAIYPN